MKIATTPLTADFLRREGFVYERLSGAFMPRLVGWQDDAVSPMLIIEDLSEARWPPPWHSASVDAVLSCIDALHDREAILSAEIVIQDHAVNPLRGENAEKLLS